MASNTDNFERASQWTSGAKAKRRKVLSTPASAVTWSENSEEKNKAPVAMGRNHFRCDMAVVNEMGLHARPASLFVELANKFECEVTVQKGSERVDGKSILQLLSLSAEAGIALVLETRGSDAQVAIVALMELVTSGFNESSSLESDPEE